MLSGDRCGLKPCLSSWKSFGLAVPALKGLPRPELGIHPVAAGVEVAIGNTFLIFEPIPTLKRSIHSFC